MALGWVALPGPGLVRERDGRLKPVASFGCNGVTTGAELVVGCGAQRALVGTWDVVRGNAAVRPAVRDRGRPRRGLAGRRIAGVLDTAFTGWTSKVADTTIAEACAAQTSTAAGAREAALLLCCSTESWVWTSARRMRCVAGTASVGDDEMRRTKSSASEEER